MIRVYSADFTTEDYKNISDILWFGLEAFCNRNVPSDEKTLSSRCENDCPHYKVCKAVAHAELYCRREFNENGEG